MSATTVGDRALAAFKSSDYPLAITLFTDALASAPEALNYYLKRSIAYQRTSKPELSLRDAEIALMLAKKRGKREMIGTAQMRRGIALYQLKRYGDAGFCFREAEERVEQKEKNGLSVWKRKLELEMEKLDEDDVAREVTVEQYPEVEIPKATAPAPKEEEKMGGEGEKKEGEGERRASVPAPQLGASAPQTRVRHEWYQTAKDVVLTFYVKGVPKDKATIEITEKSLSLEFPLPSGSDFSFYLEPLWDSVDAAASTTFIGSTKVEIKMPKANPGRQWKDLEGDGAPATLAAEPKVIAPGEAAASTKPVYPTSSKSGPKDWDKLAKELTKKEGKEKNFAGEGDDDSDDEGDEVNGFFKKLYKHSDEATRRAMMKSYIESNGTALSTNWEEVGKGKVEISPPDGMVAKKWDE